MVEYRAQFNAAPIFADINQISPYALASSISIGALRRGSQIGIMVM